MKRTLSIAHKSAIEISEPDCFGYLYKFSHKKLGGAHWRAAYFVLKDACLYLYKTDQQQQRAQQQQQQQLQDADHHASDLSSTDKQQQAIAVYYLHGYKVRNKHIERKKHTFELIPPNKKTMKPMYLMANSEIDKKR